MSKFFYLVRHGVKEKTIGDPLLSELGNQQAQLTGKFLKNLPITKIVAGPILRTRQTAEQIGKHLGLDYEISDLLRERVNWGDDPKQTFEEFVKKCGRSREFEI